jgi:Zn-finger nucleic acid-binding protein
MDEVSTQSHYDIPIKLDQCPQCGGLWFDRDELFMTKHGEAAKIDNIDIHKLFSPSTLQAKQLHCPHDQTNLVAYQDPMLPQDLHIEKCPVCAGFWFNRGEFVQFQEHCTQKRQKLEETKEFKESLDKMMQQQSSLGMYSTLGNIGTFLSTPINPATSPRLQNDIADNMRSGAMIAGAIIKILSMLFKAFLH